MSHTPSHYVHGTDPEEQRRLSRLNDILNAGSLRELGLRGGESILDLGCGLGSAHPRHGAGRWCDGAA
jgi:cyclopropane fatty-acyl-phospholipid synthase-like methyltransferase